jgi:hypothetical protein
MRSMQAPHKIPGKASRTQSFCAGRNHASSIPPPGRFGSTRCREPRAPPSRSAPRPFGTDDRCESRSRKTPLAPGRSSASSGVRAATVPRGQPRFPSVDRLVFFRDDAHRNAPNETDATLHGGRETAQVSFPVPGAPAALPINRGHRFYVRLFPCRTIRPHGPTCALVAGIGRINHVPYAT